MAYDEYAACNRSRKNPKEGFLMKKRRIALIAMWTLCIALMLSIMPMNAIAAGTTETALVGTMLTTAHAGKALSGDYYVEPGATLELRGGTGVSGLKVLDGQTLTIHIPEGSTLKVYGGNASGTTGAGAGIEVKSGSTLRIVGKGTLYASGGKAANGSSGARGDDANYVDDGSSYIPDGGYGGAGGGGAGAGIGTKGGNGGNATGWTLGFYGGRTQKTDNFLNGYYNGAKGANGNSGANADACGAIYIDVAMSANVTAVGGAQGSSGGSGGAAGNSDSESDQYDIRGIAGGSGGGGGGSGKAGANIGTGGGGGGGGGAGGGVGYAWSCYYVGAGGGGGGAGAVGGSGGAWAADSQLPDHDCGKYLSGKQQSSWSGSTGGSVANGSNAGGAGGTGCSVKIRSSKSTSASWAYPTAGTGGTGGSAGKNCSTVATKALYAVSVPDANGNSVTHYASGTEFLPASLSVPSQIGRTFTGLYGVDADGNKVQIYDGNGNRTNVQITSNIVLAAEFTDNIYQLSVNTFDNATGALKETTDTKTFFEDVTLVTPSRTGYLFRGWKISASNGSFYENAYYTYTAPTTYRMLRSNAAGQISLGAQGNEAYIAGTQPVGSMVTLYNLSAASNTEIEIEEVWIEDRFVVTLEDYNGTALTGWPQILTSESTVTVPVMANIENDYYTYAFSHWLCNINGKTYTAGTSIDIADFVQYDAELFDDIKFTAVYGITYKNKLHFEGSLGNTNAVNGELGLKEGDRGSEVIANFKITQNNGVSTLLLIPEYDASVFTIKDISINGQLVYANCQTVTSTSDQNTATMLENFAVTVTGNGKSEDDPLKILLDNDNINPDSSTSTTDVFVQIVYVMSEVVGGEYTFGFITDTPKTTADVVTHGNRSEAYGTHAPETNATTDPWEFNELAITVDSTKIKVIIQAPGVIDATNQTLVYNSQPVVPYHTGVDTTDVLENILRYTYNGYDTIAQGQNVLTINWYNAAGYGENSTPLAGNPENVGEYILKISAAETLYHTAVVKEVRVEITPYVIYVTADDQSYAYTGNSIGIDTNAYHASISKDVNGTSVDSFVLDEIRVTGVQLAAGNYINVGEYAAVIQGMVEAINGGNLDNYAINYEAGRGMLEITQAINDWLEDLAPENYSAQYNGNPVSIGSVDAKFGDVVIEYFDYPTDDNGDYILDANGNHEGERVWSAKVPKNAGMYEVRVTVEGTTNYTGLSCEVTLEITKVEINVSGFSFEAIEKTYNGEAQYWSINPDGEDATEDSEVAIIVPSGYAAILDLVTFAGMLHPQDCILVGTHRIQAVLKVSNPNYTFKNSDGVEVDSWTYDVEVKINPLPIIVAAQNQSAPYQAKEPTVDQSLDNLTFTLADGTSAPEFVLRDFTADRVIYILAVEYDENAEYYAKNENEEFGRVYPTEEEFLANQNYYLAQTVSVETLLLSKTPGINAGEYDLIAELTKVNSNYSIVATTGKFIITKQQVALPDPELLYVEYQSEALIPNVPTGYEGIYTFEATAQTDVGTYFLTAVLTDKNNYVWEDVIYTTIGSALNDNYSVYIYDDYTDPSSETYKLITKSACVNSLRGYSYVNFRVLDENTTPLAYQVLKLSSDDIVLPWYIEPKKVILVVESAPDTQYGISQRNIPWANIYWDPDHQPYSDDVATEISKVIIGVDTEYPTVSDTPYTACILISSSFNSNYEVELRPGTVKIIPKVLNQEDLEEHIRAQVKEYTGFDLSYGIVDGIYRDFIIDQHKPGTSVDVFKVTDVDYNISDDYLNANGYMNDNAFVYHTGDIGRQLYVTVTVALTDTVNYVLADGVNTTFPVEAYIAKAENNWTAGPTINSTNGVANLLITATAKFGDRVVSYYTDRECQNPIAQENMLADQTYYAKFVVAETTNFYGLEYVLTFCAGRVTISIPVVKRDGEVVLADNTASIVYDGKMHTLVIPETDSYTITGVGSGTNVGEYVVTISLVNTTNYMWSDGTTDALTYTLKITPKALTLTADDKRIPYGAAAPLYTMTAAGLVEGETLETLLSAAPANYLVCTYQQDNPVGTYTIGFSTETLQSELTNYTITFTTGVLTVYKSNFDFIEGEIPGLIIKPLPEFAIGNITVVYDNTTKEFRVNLPDDVAELISWTVTYYKDGVQLAAGELPKDVGEYTVNVNLELKDPENSNYLAPDDQVVKLIILQAEITIDVNDQEMTYNGTNYVPTSAEGQYTINFTNGSPFEFSVGTQLVAAGNYQDAGLYKNAISVSYPESTNYKVNVLMGDLTIKQAQNSWLTQLMVQDNITYDGNRVETGLDKEIYSKSQFGEVSYTYYQQINGTWYKLDEAPTKAGTYRVVATVAEHNNYTGLSSTEEIFNIQKLILEIGAITFNDGTVVYDGLSHSLTASGYPAKGVKVTYSDTSNAINVGTYTITVTIEATDPENVELVGVNTKSAVLTITPVTVTIKPINQTSPYGEPIVELTYELEFEGNPVRDDFYRSDFDTDGITLITDATNTSEVREAPYTIRVNGTGSHQNYVVEKQTGEYTITKYENNEIILTVQNIRYLMTLNPVATAARGQEHIVLTYAIAADGSFTSTVPTEVGTYYVKATIAGTKNYGPAEEIVEFKIEKAKLSKVVSVTYNMDTAMWAVVSTTTDGYTIPDDCIVTYAVGDTTLTTPSFTATAAGSYSVIAVPSDNANFEQSAATTLKMVYSVKFADIQQNHDKQPAVADLTAAAFNEQFRFEGQPATKPAADPTIIGYTFIGWKLSNGTAYTFTEAVTGNIKIFANWTIQSFTVTFYNEVEEGAKVVNGVFVPGQKTRVHLGTKTVQFGDAVPQLGETPTKAPDSIYTYTFAYWSEAFDGAKFTETTVTRNLELYAVYDKTTGMIVITYKYAIEGGDGQQTEYQQYGNSIIVSEGYVLETLADKLWFVEDGWYTDPARTTPLSGMPAQSMTLYGAYVFDIGAGDVNADGDVTADDITLYRRWVVGGYDIETVQSGKEWDTVNSNAFDSAKQYYLVSVSDANRDDSGDIRDITTIRMALTGGYGYALEENGNVTGWEVIIQNMSPAYILEEIFRTGGTYTLSRNVVLNSPLTVASGVEVELDLNGYTLSHTAECTGSYQMILNNGKLTIKDSSKAKTGKISFKDTGAGDPSFGWGSYTIMNNGTLVINGGTIENMSEYSGGHMFDAIDQAKGSTTINGGTISTPNYRSIRIRNGSLTIEGGVFDGQIWLQPSQNSVISLEINGGDFSPNGGDGSSVFIENWVDYKNVYADCTVDITGGFFQTKIGFDNASELTGSLVTGGVFTNKAVQEMAAGLINPGYKLVPNADVADTYKVVELSAEEMLTMVFRDGGSYTLKEDVVLDSPLTVAAGKEVVLDLNGHTISHTAECTGSYQMINNRGTLTINDSVGTGRISFNDTGAGDPSVKWASYTIRNEGVLVVNNGTIEHLGQQKDSDGDVINGNNAIFNYSGDTTINGGSILAQYSRSVRLWHGSLTINGGSFDGQVWVQAMSDCALTITGGTFQPATCGGDGSSVYLTSDKKVTLSVTGGTFLTKFQCSKIDNVVGTITGGEFTEKAKNESKAELISRAHEFVQNASGKYDLVETTATAK